MARGVLAPRSRLWWAATVLAFGVAQVVISTVKFDRLHAGTMDLGFQAQMFWLISHGHWYAFSTIFQTPAVASDGSLWMYPLAYVFRYAGGVYALFTVQAVATVVAAWGVARAARDRDWSPGAAYALSVVFCLAPGILGASQFDYHPDFLALPGVVWGYVWYREGRLGWATLAWVAAALAKNTALVGFVGVGLGLILTRRVRDGLLMAAGAVALVLFEFTWAFPHWFPDRTTALILSSYGYLGHGVLGIGLGMLHHSGLLVSHLVAHPGYWLWIFGPVLGLAFAGSAALGGALALFALNAASAFAPQHAVTDQYQVLLTAWLVLATLEALSRCGPRWRRRLLLAVSSATAVGEALLVLTVVVPVVLGPAGPTAAVQAAFASVPASAVVWTSNTLGSLAFARTTWGQDVAPTPTGRLVDPLRTLWREDPHGETALVDRPPTSLLMAATMAAAERAGYRVTFHRDGVVVVRGRAHFAVPQAARVLYAWQPVGSATIPAWTRRAAHTTVDWSTGTLQRATSGPLLTPTPLWARQTVRLTLQWAHRVAPTGIRLDWSVLHRQGPSGIHATLGGPLGVSPTFTVMGWHSEAPLRRETQWTVVIPVPRSQWIAWTVRVPGPAAALVSVHWTFAGGP